MTCKGRRAVRRNVRLCAVFRFSHSAIPWGWLLYQKKSVTLPGGSFDGEATENVTHFRARMGYQMTEETHLYRIAARASAQA